MEYQYGNIENAKSGDIIEYQGISNDSFTKEHLYIINFKDPIANDDRVFTNSGNSGTATIRSDVWKLILTKPGSEAKIGDSYIVTENPTYTSFNYYKVGSIHTVTKFAGADNAGVWDNPKNHGSHYKKHIRVLYKEDEKSSTPKEYQPKYKVGDRIQTDYDRYKDSIITIKEIFAPSYSNLHYRYEPAKLGEPGGIDNCKMIDARAHFHLIPPELTHCLEVALPTPTKQKEEPMQHIPLGTLIQITDKGDSNCIIGVVYEILEYEANAQKAPYRVKPKGQPGWLSESQFKIVTTQKEITMKNENIIVTMTAKEYAKHTKKHPSAACLTPKTDLEKAFINPITLTIFDKTGVKTVTKDFEKEKAAKTFRNTYLQDSDNLGSTVFIRTQSGKPVTTAIPIVKIG